MNVKAVHYAFLIYYIKQISKNGKVTFNNELKLEITHMGRYTLMMGSEAVVRGAIYAGVRFFAGYPITPATEIAEYASNLFPRYGGVYVQGEDELASINMIIGSSIAGWKSMTATSGPGFSLMQEGIGYAVNTEVPILIVDVQRGGPSTGQPTLPSQQDVMQARFGSHGSYEIIALSPKNVTENFYLTVEAVNLSEKYRTPVIILMDEILAHIWEKTYIPDPGEVETLGHLKPEAQNSDGFLVEGQLHDERGYGVGADIRKSAEAVWKLVKKIRDNASNIVKIEGAFIDDNPEVVVVSYGSVSRSSLAAVKMLRKNGQKVGYLRLITLWPFEKRLIKEKMSNVKKVIFPEMNSGYYAEYFQVMGYDVISMPKLGGEIHTPYEIYKKVEEVIQ